MGCQAPLGAYLYHGLETATQMVLRLLYFDQPVSDSPATSYTPTKSERHTQIRDRYAQGETIPELSEAFNISRARVHQIIHFRSR